MGRPPCCDKVGIKKGPWTPEEDIILVSYIQEHGPGNWRSVPTNTGLSRCSKSCRLRWTNYLRPGIKRGNFTPHEEGMIIHLQALLGNKWAAIASYLPQRTDNDIKNYWNTHLKKKLKKFQAAMDPHLASSDHHSTTNHYLSSKNFNDNNINRRSNSDHITTTTTNNNNNNNNIRLSQQSQSSSSSTTYASSTENISRLLEGWMRTSPKLLLKEGTTTTHHIQDQELLLQISKDSNNFEDNSNDINNNNNKIVKSSSMPALNLQIHHHHKITKDENMEGGDLVSHEEFDSILSFENLNNAACWDKSTCDSMPEKCSEVVVVEKGHHDDIEEKNNIIRQKSHDHENSTTSATPPLSFLEKWLLDENVGQGEEMMELSPMF